MITAARVVVFSAVVAIFFVVPYLSNLVSLPDYGDSNDLRYEIAVQFQHLKGSGVLLGIHHRDAPSIYQWILENVEFLALLVNLVLAASVILGVRQLSLAQHEAGSRIYRRFIEPPMRNVRRYSGEAILEDILTKCAAEVKSLEKIWFPESKEFEKQKARASFQKLLSDIEKRIETSRANHMKSLSVSKENSMMTVEEFLNEYEYMADLVEGGIIKANFGTELNHENNLRMFEIFWPYIKLRTFVQPKYGAAFRKLYKKFGSKGQLKAEIEELEKERLPRFLGG